jgi:hypothetical protein
MSFSEESDRIKMKCEPLQRKFRIEVQMKLIHDAMKFQYRSGSLFSTYAAVAVIAGGTQNVDSCCSVLISERGRKKRLFSGSQRLITIRILSNGTEERCL